jgi:4-diphosphocytidyl-2-C-methyl-D-erythritol kinase
MADTVTVAAAAKVNLALHIVGRRDDGFHLLESLIGFTEIADHITLTASDDISLDVSGPEQKALTDSNDNLIIRAARLVKDHVNGTGGAHFALEKHIPVAAGLGGGSADAAATVQGCETLWNITSTVPIGDATLAAGLGADVPVCRFGRAAWVWGIGERVTPAPSWPDLWMVLVNPRIPVPTAKVFQAFSGQLKKPEIQSGAGPTWSPSVDDFIEFLASRENSLTDAALSIAPVIAEVLAVISAAPECLLARMSGSGPTCFGLFASESEAQTAAKALAGGKPAWWVRATRLVSRPNHEIH